MQTFKTVWQALSDNAINVTNGLITQTSCANEQWTRFVAKIIDQLKFLSKRGNYFMIEIRDSGTFWLNQQWQMKIQGLFADSTDVNNISLRRARREALNAVSHRHSSLETKFQAKLSCGLNFNVCQFIKLKRLCKTKRNCTKLQCQNRFYLDLRQNFLIFDQFSWSNVWKNNFRQ